MKIFLFKNISIHIIFIGKTKTTSNVEKVIIGID